MSVMREQVIKDADNMFEFFSNYLKGGSMDRGIVTDFKRELFDLVEQAYKAGQWDKRDEQLTRGINGLK